MQGVVRDTEDRRQRPRLLGAYRLLREPDVHTEPKRELQAHSCGSCPYVTDQNFALKPFPLRLGGWESRLSEKGGV